MDSSASGEIRMFRRAERSGIWVGFMACLRTPTVCAECVRGQPGSVRVAPRSLVASLRSSRARHPGTRRSGTSPAPQPASPEPRPSRRSRARPPAAAGRAGRQRSPRPPGHRARVGEEIADVLLYLLRLADELGIDVMAAARAKQAAARGWFPTDGFRGVAPEKT